MGDFRFGRRSAATGLILALAGPAFAQTPPTGQEAQRGRVAIEEIVVTSKQRSESVQSVPLSITAFTRGALDRAGIGDIRDLAAFTPGFSFHSGTGRRDLSAVAMRGLAPNTVQEQLQGVSVFYDGVYFGGGMNLIQLGQVQRVEILKGPQSTTFGRATYSGAIDYITRAPKVDTLSGQFKGLLSKHHKHDEMNWQASVSVDLPIIADRLWMNGFVNYQRQGTMFKASANGVPIGKETTDSYGVTLYAEPNDAMTIKLMGLYDVADDSPSPTHHQHPQEWRARGVRVGPTTVANATWIDDAIPNPIRNSMECIQTRTRFLPDCGSVKQRYFASGIVTYDMDGYELSYRGGYYQEYGRTSFDTTNRGAANGIDPFFGTASQGLLRKTPAGTSLRERFESHSHQLRVVSPGEERLRWRGGLYYFWETNANFSEGNFSNVNAKGRSRGDEATENYSVFGGAAYDIVDRLTLELEARLQKETNFFDACPECGSRNAAGVFVPADGFNATDLKASKTEFLPRMTLSYKPTDDLLFYALYSYGTKAGRFNTSRVTNFRYVNPEELTNYEIGAKTSWLDNRLFLNGAAFIQRVKEQQFVSRDVIDPTITYTQNIGKSDIWGFEAELVFQITQAFRILGAAAYAHHEYADFSRPPAEGAAATELLLGQSLQGKTSVNVPRWNGSLGVSYTFFDVWDDANLELRADATYRGKAFADVANRSWYRPVTRLNLRATLETEQWEVGLFVRDALNNKKPLGGASGATSCVYGAGLPPSLVTATAIAAGQRCLAVNVPRGREIGLSAQFKF
jgi:outer membrane receptor protein involved in Fe transport